MSSWHKVEKSLRQFPGHDDYVGPVNGMDTNMPAEKMRMMMDCADVSKISADMMCRKSSMAMDMAAICQRLCTMSAQMCMTMPGDAQMMKLAEMCRACSDSCRTMVGANA